MIAGKPMLFTQITLHLIKHNYGLMMEMIQLANTTLTIRLILTSMDII